MRIGTDIVSVPRLADQMRELGDEFLARVFTAGELADCAGRVESLAARWAAKEAVIKAFGWELSRVDLTDIEVVGTGRPSVVLHGRPEVVSDLSMSHDGEYAIAVVLVEAPQ